MPGKARPAPPGLVKLDHIVKQSKGRWKRAALERMIREGRLEKVTGLKPDNIVNVGRFMFVKEEAANTMIGWAKTHTVNLRDLAVELGMKPQSIQNATYISKKKIGRGLFTTEEERKRLLEERKGLESS